MRTYGQYCPIARASEPLAERWSLIILRNIVLVGCRTFNEIADERPVLSPVTNPSPPYRQLDSTAGRGSPS
jgi:DNA-binding HxlR family transcriptional regulator